MDSPDKIVWEGQDVNFGFDDVIASKLHTDDENQNSSLNGVTLVAYPLRKEVRVRETVRLNFKGFEESRKFHTFASDSIRLAHPPHLLKTSSNRRVLLLTNPFSGQKRAATLWEQYGKEVMETAGIKVDHQLTEYPEHATEIMKTLDIDDYDAVLVNSGDGLVSEVLCGLLMRKDRERAFKMPICHIPGGTSNGLAAGILFNCNEPFTTRDVFITECALMAVRPRYIPLRLFNVDTEYNGKKSMFMSACWGLIADIDIGSERFRWAGMARLHIEAVLRILQLPSVAKYRGRVSYIPLNDKEVVQKTRLRHLAPRAEFGNGHFDTPEVERAEDVTIEREDDYKTTSEALDCPYLDVPPLGQPLGDNWTTIDGEWVMVNVSAVTHLGSDLPYVPSAKFGEPIMYLTMIDWKILKNRCEVADLFIRMNRGVHLTYPCLQIIPVKAVRVEPETKTGYFAIDGEPCKNGSSFQVVPLKHCATVIGRKQVQ